MGLLYLTFVCWGRFPLYSLSREFFFFLIINSCWILLKVFSASVVMIIWFLFFSLLMRCIKLIDLHVLKNPYFPRINPTWLWCMILLMCCWIWFASTLLRIFASMFISDNWPAIFFFVVSLSGFGLRVMMTSKMILGVFFPLQFLGGVSEGYCYCCFLLVSICMKYLILSPHFQSACVPRSEVGLLWIAYIWVWMYPFRQSVSFGWSI